MSVRASVCRSVRIPVSAKVSVSGLLESPQGCSAALVLAHGAGAGMDHPFLAGVAHELAALGVATLRYQFPYMEHKSKRPDPPALCHATVRAAAAALHHQLPLIPLFAGGKSFGGRMTSQAHAVTPLPGVRGLIFFGFPLHPPKRPSGVRAQHLFKIRIPLLFVQGTRDPFAQMALLRLLVCDLGDTATLFPCQEADHSFHVPAKAGRNDAELQTEMLNALVAWTGRIVDRDFHAGSLSDPSAR